MAASQLTLRAQIYGQNIMQLAQQKYSKLMPAVYVKGEGINGKTFFQDQIGKWSMEANGGLNVDSPNNDPNFSRRMATMVTYHDARLIDRSIQLQILSDPKAPSTIAAGASIGRQIDSVIIEAATGTAHYGETGSSSQALESPQIIADGGTNLTFAKVKTAKRKLDDQDVEEEDRYFVTSPAGLEKLLGSVEATSADYNTVKALVRGEIDTWMGFKWIKSTLLSVASNIRTCFAFQKTGICVGMSEAPMVRVDDLPGKSYSTQIYYELNIAAVRLEEAKVVKVDIDETK